MKSTVWSCGVVGLLSVVFPLAAGCDRTRPAADPSGQRETHSQGEVSSPPQQEMDSRDVIEALQAAQVKIKESADGIVSDCDVRGVPLTEEIVALMVRLQRPRRLYADQGKLSDEAWTQLGTIRTLELLDLRGVAMNNDQLARAVGQLVQLRALRLNGSSGACQVDDEGLAALTQCRRLKALALDHLWVGKPGLEKLQELPELEELYLAGTLVDDAALEVLSRFAALKKLRLAQTSITAAGLQHLTKLPLEELDISECSQVFDDAMEYVGQIKTLKRLNLWRDAITDAGVEKLAGLTRLQWLNLDNTQLTDAGLVYLKDMQQLEFLHLGSTLVSDAGMPHLHGLKSLRELIVTRTAVTQDGVKGIKDAIPGVKVQLKYLGGE